MQNVAGLMGGGSSETSGDGGTAEAAAPVRARTGDGGTAEAAAPVRARTRDEGPAGAGGTGAAVEVVEAVIVAVASALVSGARLREERGPQEEVAE